MYNREDVIAMTIKSEIKQRSYDKKHVLWVYTVDPTYDPSKVTEDTVPYIPQRWIMLGVYNAYKEAKAHQDKYNKKFNTKKRHR